MCTTERDEARQEAARSVFCPCVAVVISTLIRSLVESLFCFAGRQMFAFVYRLATRVLELTPSKAESEAREADLKVRSARAVALGLYAPSFADRVLELRRRRIG